MLAFLSSIGRADSFRYTWTHCYAFGYCISTVLYSVIAGEVRQSEVVYGPIRVPVDFVTEEERSACKVPCANIFVISKVADAGEFYCSDCSSLIFSEGVFVVDVAFSRTTLSRPYVAIDRNLGFYKCSPSVDPGLCVANCAWNLLLLLHLLQRLPVSWAKSVCGLKTVQSSDIRRILLNLFQVISAWANRELLLISWDLTLNGSWMSLYYLVPLLFELSTALVTFS